MFWLVKVFKCRMDQDICVYANSVKSFLHRHLPWRNPLASPRIYKPLTSVQASPFERLRQGLQSLLSVNERSLLTAPVERGTILEPLLESFPHIQFLFA